jgi:CheY-like chemotaxis protein
MREAATILVAEDQPAEVLLLKRAFAKAGVKAPVHFVKDGQEAIDYLRGRESFNDRQVHPLPTMMLLDLKMPRLDGFDVLGWVRQQPTLKRLPIVVLSSSSMPEDIDRAYDLGANSFIVKPSGMDAQKEVVEQLQDYWLGLNEMPHCAPV